MARDLNDADDIYAASLLYHECDHTRQKGFKIVFRIKAREIEAYDAEIHFLDLAARMPRSSGKYFFERLTDHRNEGVENGAAFK